MTRIFNNWLINSLHTKIWLLRILTLQEAVTRKLLLNSLLDWRSTQYCADRPTVLIFLRILIMTTGNDLCLLWTRRKMCSRTFWLYTQCRRLGNNLALRLSDLGNNTFLLQLLSRSRLVSKYVRLSSHGPKWDALVPPRNRVSRNSHLVWHGILLAVIMFHLYNEQNFYLLVALFINC